MPGKSDAEHVEPEASRPSMPPQYGIQAPTVERGVLPWTWAEDHLAQARGYWLATTRPNGHPHVAVVWGVWLHDRFYFATSASSRKGRNLAAHPHCVVCPEQTAEAVILEGITEGVNDRAAIDRFEEAYTAKYGEGIDTALFQVYRVRPLLAFATVSDAETFPATATRWRFPEASSGPREETRPPKGEQGGGAACG